MGSGGARMGRGGAGRDRVALSRRSPDAEAPAGP